MRIVKTLPAIVAALLAAHTLPAATVTVFAAASLAESLRELASIYERKSGDHIVFNFAASSTLARQLQAGAPADLFFSADEAQMDALESKGLLVTNTRCARLGNTLVVVVAARDGAPVTRIEDLAGPAVGRIALADPRAVPAGVYAREYLERLKLWPAVARKVAPAENVRAALAVVEAGNADAAIVYRTDAAISTKVRVAIEIPREQGPAIRYPVARLKSARQPGPANRFLEHLLGAGAGDVFARHGFIVLSPPPAQ
jgi:molybdate transport system substrate-binding protein